MENTTEKVVQSLTSGANTTVTTTITTSFSSKSIDMNPLIIVFGIIIVILLFPQIKKAKAGSIEFETLDKTSTEKSD